MKVGMLYQYHMDHCELMQRFSEINGQADIFEVLAIHFMKGPQELREFSAWLGDPEMTIHSGFLQLGNSNLEEMKSKTKKLEQLVKSCNCCYVGEHLTTMGGNGCESGTFLPSIISSKQFHRFIENISIANSHLSCPMILENPVEFFQYAREYSPAKFFNLICSESNTKILLSLSNIIMSEKYHDHFDRYDFISQINLEDVYQVHIYLNNEAEERQAPKIREKQKWLLETLEFLLGYDSFKPKSILFETVAETKNLVEPERLHEVMSHFRTLGREN